MWNSTCYLYWDVGVISWQKHFIPLFFPFKVWHGIGWHLTAKNNIVACEILGVLRWHRNNRSCKEPTERRLREQWAKDNTNTNTCSINPCFVWSDQWAFCHLTHNEEPHDFQWLLKLRAPCVPLKGEKSFWKHLFQTTRLSFPLHMIVKL